MHYYKFNIADWHSSTRHLNLEEEAVYFRLMNYYYDTEKPLPEDTTNLYRRLLLTDYTAIADSILVEFFKLTSNGWEKEKIKEIIKIYTNNKKKNKRNGKKGGRPILGKGCSIKPNGLAKITHSQPTGNPNQELLTTNYKPITKEKKKGKTNGFIKPGTQEINKFAFDESLNLIGFFDYYTSNGWKVGKNAMKDWKAAARGWSKRQSQYSGNKPQEINFDSTGWKQ